jgi:hypothetical protein
VVRGLGEGKTQHIRIGRRVGPGERGSRPGHWHSRSEMTGDVGREYRATAVTPADKCSTNPVMQV